MAKYRIELEFETTDEITLGMICRGLEYNDCPIRNEIFSEYYGVVGDCASAYKIVSAKQVQEECRLSAKGDDEGMVITPIL